MKKARGGFVLEKDGGRYGSRRTFKKGAELERESGCNNALLYFIGRRCMSKEAFIVKHYYIL